MAQAIPLRSPKRFRSRLIWSQILIVQDPAMTVFVVMRAQPTGARRVARSGDANMNVFLGLDFTATWFPKFSLVWISQPLDFQTLLFLHSKKHACLHSPSDCVHCVARLGYRMRVAYGPCDPIAMAVGVFDIEWLLGVSCSAFMVVLSEKEHHNTRRQYTIHARC